MHMTLAPSEKPSAAEIASRRMKAEAVRQKHIVVMMLFYFLYPSIILMFTSILNHSDYDFNTQRLQLNTCFTIFSKTDTVHIGGMLYAQNGRQRHRGAMQRCRHI